MLVQCWTSVADALRRWANIEPKLCQCIVFTGYTDKITCTFYKFGLLPHAIYKTLDTQLQIGVPPSMKSFGHAWGST